MIDVTKLLNLIKSKYINLINDGFLVISLDSSFNVDVVSIFLSKSNDNCSLSLTIYLDENNNNKFDKGEGTIGFEGHIAEDALLEGEYLVDYESYGKYILELIDAAVIGKVMKINKYSYLDKKILTETSIELDSFKNLTKFSHHVVFSKIFPIKKKEYIYYKPYV